MPKRPPLFTPAGARTAREAQQDHDRARGTSAARGYDSVWRRLRRMHLLANPLCVFCRAKGDTVAATVADHVHTIVDRPDLRLDPDNLQSLCKRCHDSDRQRQQAAERKARG